MLKKLLTPPSKAKNKALGKKEPKTVKKKIVRYPRLAMFSRLLVNMVMTFVFVAGAVLLLYPFISETINSYLDDIVIMSYQNKIKNTSNLIELKS